MKKLFYIVSGSSVIIVLSLIIFSIASHKAPELGVFNGKLYPCPPTPNCVSSEIPGTPAYIDPFTYTTTSNEAWRKIKQAITTTGGEVITDHKTYLHAIYVTPLIRFVDDVELRLDDQQHLIHIRSASRVGRSDLGANRQRVEKIRAVWQSK